jgi:dissimilatory sulfite reductase (desulfoviridin) alpha/beta subunit
MKDCVITERDPRSCTVSIPLPVGIFSVEQMREIDTIAKRYGVGFVHHTSNLKNDLQFKPFRDDIKKEIASPTVQTG